VIEEIKTSLGFLAIFVEAIWRYLYSFHSSEKKQYKNGEYLWLRSKPSYTWKELIRLN